MSSPSKRREMDLMKLMMSDYKVEMINDGMQDFYVDFHGPNDSLYQGGVWRVRVELPDAYPYKSPSIGFVNKIYHPNVDERVQEKRFSFILPQKEGFEVVKLIQGGASSSDNQSMKFWRSPLDKDLKKYNPLSGSVCLDVINQTWSPMFDLVNVFEAFLPQLLLYPNPSDPLNGEAAALMMRDRPAYEKKVKEYCEKYAKPEDAGAPPEDQSSDEELSEDEYDSSDEGVVGKPDP